MEVRQIRKIERVGSVRRFLRELVNPTAALIAARVRFLALAKRIEDVSLEQGTARTQLPTDGNEIRALRLELREGHMLPLSRLAKTVLKYAPNVERALKVPHARANTEVLLATEKHLRRALKPHAKLLIKVGGLEKDFLARMSAAARRLQLRSQQTDSAMRRRSKATRELRQALSQAALQVALIDGLVRPLIRDDASLETVWRLSKRIPPRRGRPKKKRQPPQAS